MRIDTRYPQDGNVTCTVEGITGGETVEFEIAFRIPGFARNSLISLNGEPPKAAPAGMFYRIRRRWRAGDAVTLCVDMHPRLVCAVKTESVSGESAEEPFENAARGGYAAVCVGPLVLAKDRRLGGVGERFWYDKEETEVRPCHKSRIPFACQCAYEVKLGDRWHTMVDYASAGKSWRRDSELEVWMALQ